MAEWYELQPDFDDHEAAIGATRRLARDLLTRGLLEGLRPSLSEELADTLAESLRSSKAAGGLLSLRWGRDATATVLEALVAARLRQVEIDLDRLPPPAPFDGASAAQLRDLREQQARVSLLIGDSAGARMRADKLSVFAFVQSLIENRRHGRPAEKPWSPLRYVAEGVDAALPALSRLERDELAAALTREVLGESSSPGKVLELMKGPRRRRRTARA